MKNYLRKLLKEIFDLAFDMDVCAFATEGDLARAANLQTVTVQRLRRGITKEPRLSTLYKLAKAIKADLELVREAVLEASLRKSRKRVSA